MDYQLIDAKLVESEPKRTTYNLTASRWSACDRKMWFNFRNVLTEELTAKTLRTFAIGHALEDMLCQGLEKAGLVVAMREAKLLNKWGKTLGMIDGIVKYPDGTFRLLENKTMNDKNFKELLKNGIPPHYYAQVQLYMHHSGQLSNAGNKLTECLFQVLNKNTSELFTQRIPYDVHYAEAQTQRIELVVDSESLPRGSESIECRWCNYRNFCQGGAIPEINCRTCANVSVASGEFHCEFGSSPCSKHLIHPQIMELAGYEVQMADRANMNIHYPHFINGEHHLTSYRIKELYDALLLDDETAMDVVSHFDATLIPF